MSLRLTVIAKSVVGAIMVGGGGIAVSTIVVGRGGIEVSAIVVRGRGI